MRCHFLLHHSVKHPPGQGSCISHPPLQGSWRHWGAGRPSLRHALSRGCCLGLQGGTLSHQGSSRGGPGDLWGQMGTQAGRRRREENCREAGRKRTDSPLSIARALGPTLCPERHVCYLLTSSPPCWGDGISPSFYRRGNGGSG